MLRHIKKIGIVLGCLLLCSCWSQLRNRQADVYNKKEKILKNIIDDNNTCFVLEENNPNLIIHEGFISQEECFINVKRGDGVVACIHLSSPIIIAQSEREEEWGFFQFPKIFRDRNGALHVAWQMNTDSHTSYGKGSSGHLMSNDEGRTWEEPDSMYYYKGRYRVDLSNGNTLQVKTTPSRNIKEYPFFPKPIKNQTVNHHLFYLEKNLPDDLRGVYFEYWNSKNNQVRIVHGTIKDSLLLRYAIDDVMPIVWWGDIKEIENHELVAGVYGGFYQDNKGHVQKTAVSFYMSNDYGNNWILQGIIPFQNTGISTDYDGGEGYGEPAFEILKDGRYLCIMRSGYAHPMFKAYSDDKGKTWTKPVPFTPNGVFPVLCRLDNGVLVLISGRPGLQLRFCLAGDGDIWTEPIEMMPFMDHQGRFDIYASCGYSSVLPVDDDTFYFVYSDFKTKNKVGDERKSIVFRKVDITLKN